MTSKPLAFLKAVLPAEGYKCAAIFEGKYVRQTFHLSFEELETELLAADALGRTVYHACASFQTKDSRKGVNALGARSLWLDVDAGEGKAYPDAVAAAEAVQGFCRAANLPPPIYVGSGFGLHVYWPLVQTLDPATWARYAGGLQQLCARLGLAVDTSRTEDISSILRTPGTHNRKDSVERIVQVGPIVGPYELENFNDLFAGTFGSHDLSELRTNGKSLFGVPVVSQQRTRRSLVADALNIYGASEPADTGAVSEQCAQVAALARSNGNLSEPAWYAVLGVLAYTEGGEDHAHEHSRGYGNYTYDETQGRLERAREFGPTTCAHFAKVNPAGCAGCPLRGTITSPIQLGRGPIRDDSSGAIQESVSEQRDERDQNEEIDTLPALPTGFVWRNGSLCLGSETPGGADDDVVVSQYPLYLKAVQTGEINGDSFSLSFDLRLPNAGTREIVLPAKTFFSASGISEISGKGAVIHDVDCFKKYTRLAIDMFNKEHNLEQRYEQFGWKEDTEFLYGPSLYTPSAVYPALGSEEVRLRSQHLYPMKGGSLERWSNAANALFAKGCEPQSFALLASFAAPLMRFHSSGEGGAIISLVNDKSGSGKTTALEAVASVWGREEGLKITDDDTKVSKGLTLGALGNLPVIYDELYSRDPEVIRQFVLMFTNGRDKMRGTRDGEIRHTKATWQTILVLASNNSIVDVLSSLDGTDAPAFRLLEFHTEIPKGVRKGDELKRELKANSGWAGDAYLRRLVQPETLAYIRRGLPQWTDEVWKYTGLGNEHRFWVRTIASVIAASTIVQNMGILEFSPQRVVKWAMDELKGRASAGGGVATEIGRRDPINILSEFIHEHVRDMLVVQRSWKQSERSLIPLIKPTGKLLVRYEIEDGRIYIAENALRKYLVKMGIDRHEFAKTLFGVNVLMREGKRVTLGAGTEYASGQLPTYEINARHPAMTGVLTPVEVAYERDVETGRVTR